MLKVHDDKWLVIVKNFKSFAKIACIEISHALRLTLKEPLVQADKT